MRIGEILGLKWEDLSWEKHSIRVKRQLQRDPECGSNFAPPKTKAGLRTITIGPKTISNLRNLHQKHFQQKKHFISEWREIDLIFTEVDGSPMRYSKLINQFKELLKNAGLPEIRFHDLRHTAATQMLVNGVDILTVSKRLGHSKSSITLDVYGHLIPGVQEKAANIMDEITTPVTLFTRETAPKLHQE
jgi:integrase